MNQQRRNPVLVTGSHRSGTTFMGKLLSKSGLFYIQEPFNKVHGIKGINHWFPYPDSYYKALVDSFMEGKAEVPFTTPSDNVFKRYLKKIIGSRSFWQYFYFCHLAKKDILIKDPNACFLSIYFHQKYNFSVLVLMRHPVSFYLSLKRLNWTFDFSEFVSQKELVENHYTSKDLENFKNISSFEEMAAQLWYAIYKVIDDYNSKLKASKRWIIVRHEDFSEHPFKVVKFICDNFNLNFNKKMETYIKKYMFGNKVEGKGVIDFKRDAKRLAWSFKKKVDDKTKKIIRSITESVSYKYYSDAEW